MFYGQGFSDMETQSITPLADERREILPTDEAAAHLNRQPQTLRAWASTQKGPIKPVKVVGRLGWRTADIRRLVGMTE